jgi:hypothetical protein
MPTLVWLIEADVFGRSFEPIKAEIRSQGMVAEIVQPRAFLNGVVPRIAGRALGESDCVVFSGTYPLMRHIQLHHRWVPGGWCNAEQFDCRRYYPFFGKHLLNSECCIVPIDDALARTDALFEQFGEQGEVFLRPCPVEKIFTGRCVERDSFVLALQSARYSQCQVLIARPRPMDREWRVVVADGRVLAGSQYRKGGQVLVTPDCPGEVRSYVEGLLAATEWRPDPIFLMDVCESVGEIRLLEVNSFSCSGLYQCDPVAIVTWVKNCAIEEWTRAQSAG